MFNSAIHSGKLVTMLMLIDRRINKYLWDIYTIEYYSDIIKNEITLFTETWMDLEIIILSEVTDTEG